MSKRFWHALHCCHFLYPKNPSFYEGWELFLTTVCVSTYRDRRIPVPLFPGFLNVWNGFDCNQWNWYFNMFSLQDVADRPTKGCVCISDSFYWPRGQCTYGRGSGHRSGVPLPAWALWVWKVKTHTHLQSGPQVSAFNESHCSFSRDSESIVMLHVRNHLQADGPFCCLLSETLRWNTELAKTS